MTLLQLQSLLKDARLARNSNATNALAAAISDIQCAQGRSSDTFDETQILISIRKTRDVFEEEVDQASMKLPCGSEQLAKLANLEARRDILTDLLPKVIDESRYGVIVAEHIQQTGATGMKDMGKVLTSIKTQYGLQINPAIMSSIVKGVLSGK